jgi:UDP:flavonoid glycosyltransferase YjiC (YdhE family)
VSRILFSFTGGRGHAEPLVPLARAAETAGHEVGFAGRAACVPEMQAPGFRTFAAGPTGVPERAPLLEPDMEREERILRDAFAGSIARLRAADLFELCGEYPPSAARPRRSERL